MNHKEQLYGKYISSGQAGRKIDKSVVSPDIAFKSRAPYVKYLINKTIPTDRKIRIVDLGCGHGTYVYFLKKYGYTNIIGIDDSSEQVQFAKDLGIDEVIKGDISEFVRNNKEKIDVVLLMDVIEHLSLSDTMNLLEGINKCLTEGGKVIMHTPNAEGVFGMRIRYGDLTHEQAFTPMSMRQLMQSLDYTNIISYEDKPLIYDVKSFIRRIIWTILTIPFRLILIAETGMLNFVMSQNMLTVANKKSKK